MSDTENSRMNAVQLAFEEYGEANSKPLIIIHGFFASSRNWRQMAKRFATHYHVFVLDMRNHGKSPHNASMDYPLMAEDVGVFMDENNLASANILGHSMGGKVAMWFALNNPEKIQNLIIADISPVNYQHSFDKTVQALKSIPLEQISNRKQADNFLSITIPDLSYRLFLLQNLQLHNGKYSWRVNLDIFQKTADNIVGFPFSQTPFKFSKKVLFIMGGNSTYTNTEAIYTYFPEAEIDILEEANHWLHIDKPDDFYTKVSNFVR